MFLTTLRLLKILIKSLALNLKQVNPTSSLIVIGLLSQFKFQSEYYLKKLNLLFLRLYAFQLVLGQNFQF